MLSIGLSAQQETEFVEKKARRTFIADNPSLLKPFQFRDLQISLPKNSATLSDTVKQVLQRQMETSNPGGFKYEIGLVHADSLGNVFAVSRIKNVVPDSSFAYLKEYAPGPSGEFALKKLILDPICIARIQFC